MKRITITAVAALLLCGCGSRGPLPAGRLYQPKGDFSFVTPEGWQRRSLSGIDFIIVSAKTDYGAQPNIFVDFIDNSSAISNTLNRVLSRNRETYSDYTVSKQEAFTTLSGLSGIKLTAGRTNRDGLPLANFLYQIASGRKVISITCTCAASVSTKYEPIFDSALKSLQVEERGKQRP